MEAWAGIEPAIRVLQTLALPLGDQADIVIYQIQLYLIKMESNLGNFWSDGPDSNRRPSPWKGDILPLNYRRIIKQPLFA